MRISDWSSDVCSSDLVVLKVLGATRRTIGQTFLLEYGLLGLVTAIIAAAIGTLAAWLVLTEIMRADFVFLPRAVITTAVLATADRKSVVEGKSVSVRVDLGGRRIIKKKKKKIE